MSFHAYILRCANGAYYAGHTDDLAAHLAAQDSGELGGYTARHRPVTLMWSQEFPTREEALAAERHIKGWSREKKEALIAGDWHGIPYLARKLLLGNAADAATQDKREPVAVAQPPVVLSRGLSEAEGPVSKGGPVADAGPIIVLVRPQLGQNIGKAARAMLNFGLTEMRLVAPRDGWPNPDAGPSASGADVVLEQAAVFDTVQEAIADCSTVYASTVRRRDLVMPVVAPDVLAAAIHASAGRSAILFGPERSGLETDDVALANAIVTVPINPRFGSLNLAQAVILLAYEWSRSAPLTQPTDKVPEPPAPQAEVEGLIGQLDEALVAAQYFHPPERAQVTRNTIRTIFTKTNWSSREVKAVRGIFRALGSTRPRRG